MAKSTVPVPCSQDPLLGKSQHDLLIDIACSLRRLVVIMSSGSSTPGLQWFALGGNAPDNGDGEDGETWGDSDTGKLWNKSGGAWAFMAQGSVGVTNTEANFVSPDGVTREATLVNP